MTTTLLFDRFAAHLETLLSDDEAWSEGPWVVAVSGGVDSMVLLDLLRRWDRADLCVAHVDHGMRPRSADDAEWVRAFCAERAIPCRVSGVETVPMSEADARTARYEALDACRIEVGARFVVTGHHADDQAETVLFRTVRGTGVDGLAGIPARAEGRLRPLLPFSRGEIEAYARARALAWVEDETNASSDFARNVLRSEIIPRIETAVAPGARAALARLAANARDDRVAWAEVLSLLDDSLGVRVDESALVADRDALGALGPALQRRVLLSWIARLGGRVDRAGVERARRFLVDGRSGHGVDLVGGMRFDLELDQVVLTRAADGTLSGGEEDAPVEIGSPVRGVGEATIGGASIPVAWAAHTHAVQREHVGDGVEERFSIGALRFPLTVRGRRPGDRIAMAGGTRKVKKVLLEARIASRARDEMPLLVDAEGAVLWVPGVARSRDARSGGRMLTVRIGR
ncbi:MAG: tRNA lysidine(34) synthetase TilS [Gemmatimonadota bacterium]